MRPQFFCLLLVVLCLGCGDANQRRQAEQNAAINNLKQVGKAMHECQTSDSTSNATEADSQDNAAGSAGGDLKPVAMPE